MRQLLALLDCGTRGTPAEPTWVPRGVHGKSAPVPILTAIGTLGTHGTLETNQAAAVDDLAQRVADLAEAYAERIAIVMEAGDIGEAEARRISEAEIGRRFVETFMPGEVSLPRSNQDLHHASASERPNREHHHAEDH